MKIMLQNKFNQEILELLELEDTESIHEMIIGDNVDSLGMLNIMSFYEENFNITLEPNDILGKNLSGLYSLIG